MRHCTLVLPLFCIAVCTEPNPYKNLEQKSIGEFLASAAAGDPNLKTIRNPLARELGVRSFADAEDFVQTVLPTYKLVSISVKIDIFS